MSGTGLDRTAAWLPRRALVIGLAMEVSALYIPSDYKQVIAFAFLILTLLIRPNGLFATLRSATA